MKAGLTCRALMARPSVHANTCRMLLQMYCSGLAVVCQTAIKALMHLVLCSLRARSGSSDLDELIHFSSGARLQAEPAWPLGQPIQPVGAAGRASHWSDVALASAGYSPELPAAAHQGAAWPDGFLRCRRLLYQESSQHNGWLPCVKTWACCNVCPSENVLNASRLNG